MSKKVAAAVGAALVVAGGIGAAIWTGVAETAINWAKLAVGRRKSRLNSSSGFTNPTTSEETSDDQPTS